MDPAKLGSMLLLQGLHLTRYISFLQLSYKFKTLYVLGMKMIRFLTAIVLIMGAVVPSLGWGMFTSLKKNLVWSNLT